MKTVFQVGDRVRQHVTGKEGIVVQTIKKYKPYIIYTALTETGEPLVGKGLTSSGSAIVRGFGGMQTDFSFVESLSIHELLTHPRKHIQDIGLRKQKAQGAFQ